MPVDERARVGEQRPDVRTGQVGEHRPPAGGQLRRQPHADVGHQRRAARRPLLDDVEHLAAVQHGQVRGVPDRVDQPRQHRPGQPRQWLLPGVGTADLERAHAESVAAFLRQVDDETGGDQLGQQVVGRRAGQAEVAGQRGRGDRAGLASQGLQQGQRVACRGNARCGPAAAAQDRLRHHASLDRAGVLIWGPAFLGAG